MDRPLISHLLEEDHQLNTVKDLLCFLLFLLRVVVPSQKRLDVLRPSSKQHGPQLQSLTVECNKRHQKQYMYFSGIR